MRIPVSERYPMSPFPAGWFRVATASEVKVGQVTPLHYFGRELALFRSESGTLRLVDALCPHLGAHLGIGGRVEGEQLRCPFHGWAFSGKPG